MKRIALVIFVFVLFSTATVRGEPAGDLKDVLAGRFLAWLTTEAPGEGNFFSASCTAVSIDGSEKPAPADLAGRYAGGRVLAMGFYTGRPTTLASDLSEQLQAVQEVPADRLAFLIVPVVRTVRANQIAADFVGDLLRPTEEDAVGVAVIWYPDIRHHSLLDGATPAMKLAMVLFSAPGVSGHAPRIGRVVFGDLVAPANTDK